MNRKEFETYLKERYNDQIDWYARKATTNKRLYTCFQWSVIVLSAGIPVMVASIPDNLQIITIITSIILAVGTAGLKTFKFQENWINYRTISETLKKEKYFYDANLDDYSNTSNKESLFVERVETLISRENSLWVTTHFQNDDDTKNKGSTSAKG